MVRFLFQSTSLVGTNYIKMLLTTVELYFHSPRESRHLYSGIPLVALGGRSKPPTRN